MPGLARYFDELWGFDLSPKMLELGRQFCPVPVKWIEGNGTDLANIPAASCDYVLSYVVFQHIPSATSIERYIQEATRVVRPEGVVQLHMRSRSDSLPEALIRYSPSVLRRLAGEVMQVSPWLHLDGNVESWLGCIVPERDAVACARASGLFNARALPDSTHRDRYRYWLVGQRH